MGLCGEKWVIVGDPGEPTVFLGEFEHSLDDRGRIAIPAKFRASLNSGLVITHGIDRCLLIWPMPEWQAVAQRFTQLPLMHADARRMHRLLFSGAVDIIPDRMGRIVMPSPLRAYAEIQDSAVIVGLLNRLEIWSPSNWQKERAAAEENSSQLAEHLFSLGM